MRRVRSAAIGNRERVLLASIEAGKPVELGGADRAERVAIYRAARSLECKGLADTFTTWNEKHTALALWIVKAGSVMPDGKPWKSVSVACAPPGTDATLKRRLAGSLRSIAADEGVSVATVRRDLAKS